MTVCKVEVGSPKAITEEIFDAENPTRFQFGEIDHTNPAKRISEGKRLVIYYEDVVTYSDLSIKDFVLIVSGAFAIVIASSYYPAKKASEVDILTVLRNE